MVNWGSEVLQGDERCPSFLVLLAVLRAGSRGAGWIRVWEGRALFCSPRPVLRQAAVSCDHIHTQGFPALQLLQHPC